MKVLALFTLLLSIALPTQAFDKRVYVDITDEITANATFQVNYTGTITFTNKARRQIRKAIRSLDCSIAGIREVNSDWHFYNERFEDASERLKLYKGLIATALSGNTEDPDKARELFGKALNTLQDFYAHTNWIELGNTAIDPRLGREIFEDGNAVNACVNGVYNTSTTTLTSGWMHCRRAPEGKCCSSALDKNNDGADNFELARRLASEASKDYLDQVVEALDDQAALRRFVDRDTAVIFVIDTTESMREELMGIKNASEAIVNRFNGSQVGRYIAISFADNNDGANPIRSITTTADPEAFLETVYALEANSDGGGDCRESGWDALDVAIDEAVVGSNIFFWSDSAQRLKPSWLIPPFSRFWRRIRACFGKHTHIDFVLTGFCLPFGTSYRLRLQQLFARITGASIYEVEPDEVGSLTFDN